MPPPACPRAGTLTLLRCLSFDRKIPSEKTAATLMQLIKERAMRDPGAVALLASGHPENRSFKLRERQRYASLGGSAA